MSFDVPKLVRSPGCDHGHDEESRNGRDIKIDILDGYLRTPEVFRVISEKTGEPEGYRNPPGEVMGHMGLSGERGAARGGPRASSPLVRIGLGEGGGPPFPKPIRFGPWGGSPHSLCCPLFPLRPIMAHLAPGGFR